MPIFVCITGNHINTCCPDHSIAATSYSDESGQPHRDGKLFKMSPSKVQGSFLH